MRRVSVGIVDDHPVVLSGVESGLASAPDIDVRAVGSTAAEAAALLGRDDLDVVLLDIRLPDGNGIALLERTMTAQRPAVIVLSSFEARQYVAAAIRFGAQGFMLKTAPIEVLIEAVRTVAAGALAYSAEQLTATAYVALTRRERELVRLVAAALSNDEIAAVFRTSRKTVETQLTRLYERLGVSSRTELAVRAEREGWLETQEASI